MVKELNLLIEAWKTATIDAKVCTITLLVLFFGFLFLGWAIENRINYLNNKRRAGA